MFLPRPFKNFLKILRGDVSPALIVLSTTLGFTFGVVPGVQGLHVALLAVALVLNVNIGMFIFLAAMGKAFAFAAAPLLYHAGRFVQESMPFIPRTLARIPVAAITDFDRFAVCGGLLIGPLLGIAAGLLLARSVTAFRHSWLSFEEGSPKFQAWRSKRWVRLLDWLLLGRSARDVKAVLSRQPKYVRVPGVVAAVVLIAAGGSVLGMFKDRLAAAAVADSLTRANGAEANVAKLEVHPLAGTLDLQGLQLTDPERPDHNRFALGQVKASLSLWRLLCGTIRVDELRIASLERDQKRSRPGVVPPLTRPGASTPAGAEAGTFDPTRYGLPGVDAAKLESYLKDGRQLREYLDQISDWLPRSDKDQPAAPPKPGPPESYLACLNARAITAPTPRLLIEKLVIENVLIPDDAFGRSRVSLANLSDTLEGAAQPVTIELQSLDRPALLAITFHYEDSDGGATISGRLDGVDLRKFQGRLSDRNPVTFAGGTCNAGIEGRIGRASMDVGIACRTMDMKLASGGGGRLFGMDPGLSSEVTRALDHLDTRLRLVGPLYGPRLVFDTESLKRGFSDALVGAGKGQLARQLDRLGPGLGGAKLGEAVQQGDLGKAAQQAIGGLLQGTQPDPKKPPKQTTTKRAEKPARR